MSEIAKIQKMLDAKQITPVIVLARSRTGSNLLVSLLNSHPKITVRGEKCARLEGRDLSEVLLSAFSVRSPKVCVAGFKVFYYHPNDRDSDMLWNALVGLSNLKVIHLKRENILRTLVSRKIASVQDVWKAKSGNSEIESETPTRVQMSEAELLKGFQQTRAWEDWGEQLFQNHATISVTYEDLVKDRETIMSRLFEFLGVEVVETETFLEKQNTKGLAQIVENFGELKKVFRDTTWSCFFDEESEA